MIRRFQATAFGILIAMKDPEAASIALVSAMTDEIAKLPQGRRVAWLRMMSAMTRSYNTPWMRYFSGFDPASILRKLSCPTLVMYGELDNEVSAAPNVQTMEFVLKGSLAKDYKVQIETGLNHLFQSSKSGSPSEYEQIEETISPVPLKTLGDWIVEHSK
jgi:pimeloyl-ACP methyl ester carboxylesterase